MVDFTRHESGWPLCRVPRTISNPSASKRLLKSNKKANKNLRINFKDPIFTTTFHGYLSILSRYASLSRFLSLSVSRGVYVIVIHTLDWPSGTIGLLVPC